MCAEAPSPKRTPETDAFERLIGTWRLLSFQMQIEDTGEITEPWGRQPKGWLVLTPKGRLITVITAGGLSAPTTDKDATSLLHSMTCYSGKTRMEGKTRFMTDVDVAWVPAWLGTQQGRSFDLNGEILSVHTDVSTNHPFCPGRPLHFILKWQRDE